MAYSNRQVYKNVVSQPAEEIAIKHLNYGDMISSTLVLDFKQINTNPRDITYVIVVEDDASYHYFVTSIQFLTKGKFQLGLYRNVWTDVNLSSTFANVLRGTPREATDIANYKPNSMEVNSRKVKEIYITDDFTEMSAGTIAKPSSWGILYTSRLDEEAENPTVELEQPPYVISGTEKLESQYYRDININTPFRYNGLKDKLVVHGIIDRNISRYAVYDVAHSISRGYKTDDLIITNVIKLAEVEAKDFDSLITYIDTNTVIYLGVLLGQFGANTIDEVIAFYIGKNISYFDGPTISYRYTGFNDNLSIKSKFGQPITINNITYTYQTDQFVSEQEDAIIKITEGETTSYYKTVVKKSIAEDNINQSDITVNIESPYNWLPNTYKGIYYPLSIDGIRSFIKEYLRAYDYDKYIDGIFGQDILTATVIGAQYSNRAELNKLNGVIRYKEVYNLLTQSYSYNTLEDFSVSVNKAQINNGLIIAQPYGIIAMPLFDLRIKTISGFIDTSGADSQKLFYALINKYSGGSAPFIIDAQIIPYAPTIFNQNRKTDNGIYVDYSGLSDIIATKTDKYNGTPVIMLNSADINVNRYITLDPYPDIQKEYTCRNYRIQSPAQDGAFDFKFYDYSRVGDKFIEDGAIKGDTYIQIDITLKPFGLYMHASPYVRDNSIVANKEYDDMRGLICGSGIFQSSMTSSAFETYRRENSMFQDIQNRKIESLNINQDVERTSEKMGAVLGTMQATAQGAMSGGAMADFMVMGNNAKGAGAIVGAAAAAAAAATTYAIQYQKNEELRARELADAKYFFDASIKTIKNLPNSVNRVSGLNQDILNHFCVYIEVYDCTAEELALYDILASMCGNRLEVNGIISDYLNNGKFIQAKVFKTGIKAELVSALKNDLEKGVYYYEEI